ncbi:hypothetical protein AACH06_25160 [Ideonella sp. DXS29W]|uniref:Uncharacterized protein n=1 Tax=Ideonella lacteola TaxID=2984193 RepID=A0ABU9BXH3_9BURK
MLICDKLVFIELQKTGSTHIKQLLRELVGGLNDGKHNTPDRALLSRGLPFVGSVRNPWLWYLSLWSYGCQGKGELFQRLTNEKRWQRLREKAASRQPTQENSAEGARPGAPSPERRLPLDWDVERARSWYADPDDAHAFREWLQAVLARRAMRQMLMAGYGKSPLGKAAGLMTYRYFSLFVQGADQLGPMFDSLPALQVMDRSNCIVSHFIRNESLATDFIETLEACGVPLNDAQRDQVLSARKVNTSTRPHGPSYYYDDESIKLVARREKFIIDKFGYAGAAPRRQAASAGTVPADVPVRRLAPLPRPVAEPAPRAEPVPEAVPMLSAGARLMAEAEAARQRRKERHAEWMHAAAGA